MRESSFGSIVGFHDPEEEYGCFSNWYMAPFLYGRKEYNCVEQYMMAQKVCLGGRYDLEEKIMESDDPAEIKSYGSKESFPEFTKIKSIWDKNSRYIVKRAIRDKYVQNPDLLEKLMGTGQSLICECAGKDRVWGIGININDPSWKNVKNWNGENKLGITLMELRDEFRELKRAKKAIEYMDYVDEPASEVWKSRAGALRMNPRYYEAVHAYADQLPYDIRTVFYEETFEEVENMMRTNMGGGLPGCGFFEMKQDIYEITARAELV